ARCLAPAFCPNVTTSSATNAATRSGGPGSASGRPPVLGEPVDPPTHLVALVETRGEVPPETIPSNVTPSQFPSSSATPVATPLDTSKVDGGHVVARFAGIVRSPARDRGRPDLAAGHTRLRKPRRAPKQEPRDTDS